MDDNIHELYFRLFKEIGIIEQLSRNKFEALLPKGILLAQFALLNHLVNVDDGATPLKLARAFQVPKTSMTHTLAVLKREEFIEFGENPKDGRSFLVFITDKGRKFQQSSIQLLAQKTADFVKIITPNRVEDILPDLENLRKYLDADRD